MIRIRESIKNKNRMKESLMKSGSWGAFTFDLNYLGDSSDQQYELHVGLDLNGEESMIDVTIESMVKNEVTQYHKGFFDSEEHAKKVGEEIAKAIKSGSVQKVRSIVRKYGFDKY